MHNYMPDTINPIIWDVIKNKIPKLNREIKKILKEKSSARSKTPFSIFQSIGII